MKNTQYAKNLKRLREAKGLTQEEMSIMMGVTKQTISGWEKEKFAISKHRLDEVCQILGTTPQVVLDGDTNEEKFKRLNDLSELVVENKLLRNRIRMIEDEINKISKIIQLTAIKY